MLENLELLVFILPTALFLLIGAFARIENGRKPKRTIVFSNATMFLGLGVALAGAILVAFNGQTELDVFSIAGLGITFRIDALSMVMYNMIAILGFVVLRFSFNYLDGDKRHAIFLGRMTTTIAAVQLLVLAGNLIVLFFGWLIASLALHKLILFYADRSKAQNAAKKKFIIARLSDISLLVSFILLYVQFETGNLTNIFTAIQDVNFQASSTLELAVFFLVLAAIFKSAQFPTHGWLIEVMETPTPVSALLHAGLLNAGPFIIIRMAFLMDAVYFAPIVLIIVGAISAIYGSVVYITQPSVKTALSYSSVAHMGFTLMTCGFGVYAAAMLHLTGHSFYKAHAFLSSGTNIEKSGSSKYSKSVRSGQVLKISLGILTSLVIYLGIAYLWDFDFEKDIKLLVVGAVIVLGLGQLLAQTFDSGLKGSAIAMIVLRAVVLTISFFGLESLMHALLASEIPHTSVVNNTFVVLMVFVLAMFGTVIFAQIFAPLIKQSKFTSNLGVHIRNGLYINVYFNKLIKAYKK
jgi:NAD(P)H-quinone oxidoreductase subunit 5